MKHKVAAALLAVVVLYPPHGANAQGARIFSARLSPVPLDAKMGVTSSVQVLDSDADRLEAVHHRDVRGLRSPASVARITRAEAGPSRPRDLDLKVSTVRAGRSAVRSTLRRPGQELGPGPILRSASQ